MGYISRINGVGDAEGNFSLVARNVHANDSSQFAMYPVGVFRLNENLTALPVSDKINQRTNGPVNAHLRSAAYTNKHV